MSGKKYDKRRVPSGSEFKIGLKKVRNFVGFGMHPQNSAHFLIGFKLPNFQGFTTKFLLRVK